jgi:hypothetical protein
MQNPENIGHLLDKALQDDANAKKAVVARICSYPKIILRGAGSFGLSLLKLLRKAGCPSENLYFWDIRADALREIEGIPVALPFTGDFDFRTTLVIHAVLTSGLLYSEQEYLEHGITQSIDGNVLQEILQPGIWHQFTRAFRLPRMVEQQGFWAICKFRFIQIFGKIADRSQRARDFGSRHVFVSRSQNNARLIVILAGHKNHLWPTTLARVKRFVPKDHDVCVVSPGLFSETLRDACARHGFSYLSTRKNSPGIGVNIAIELHRAAEFIYKLDEDIFIGEGFFEDLLEAYWQFYRETNLEPGFIAPTLNINGISYLDFLAEIGETSDYLQTFGELTQRCYNVKVYHDPKACLWLWQRSLPFDAMAARFRQRDVRPRFNICPTRFSIGAILFSQNFWKRCKGFASSWVPGELGIDEEVICMKCVDFSRPMVIARAVFGGHFSFGPQDGFMKQNLVDLSKLDPVCFPPEMFSERGKDHA